MTLQLVNSVSGDARGNRYTAAERDAAYLTWRTVGRRSFSATADALGIAENTLRMWGRSDNWAGRVASEDAETAEIAKVAVTGAVIAEMDANISKLVSLRDTADNERVQLDATLALLAIGGITTKQTATVTTTARAATPSGKLSTEERESLVSRLGARVLGEVSS